MQPVADPSTLGFEPSRLARLDKHFAQYVDDGRLPGWQLAITRHDQLAHVASYGWRDREAGLPVEPDTVWWIASMTKPLTSVTAMTLWEEGVFDLNAPISRWIPSYENVRVWAGGTDQAYTTVPAIEPIRVWHLLAHASGLSAGFIRSHTVDALHRKAGYDGSRITKSLEECVEDFARLPLLFQPGTRWGYGVSTDVLGRLIEIWTGESLADAMASRVLTPLGMTDTVWHADATRSDRLAALYVPSPPDGKAVREPNFDANSRREPAAYFGGGGLLSTLADYTRFTRMLARGGELDGTRILSPNTLRLMTQNHLTDELSVLSTGGFSETLFQGVGFGLGFAVLMDPVRLRSSSSPGEFYWGGAASTTFWVDPVKDVTAVWLTHLLPSNYHPIRPELRQLVYSALLE